jgi:hypothetical protein
MKALLTLLQEQVQGPLRLCSGFPRQTPATTSMQSLRSADMYTGIVAQTGCCIQGHYGAALWKEPAFKCIQRVHTVSRWGETACAFTHVIVSRMWTSMKDIWTFNKVSVPHVCCARPPFTTQAPVTAM